MTSNKGPKLTPLQELFISEYLVDLNGKAAMLRAGYNGTEASAKNYAYEVLQKEHVQEALQEKLQKRVKKIEITQERVLEGLAELAFTDLGDAFDDEGQLLSIKEMPLRMRRALSSVKVYDEFDGVGNDREKVGETTEIRIEGRTRNLENLGRYLKMFTDKLEHSGKADLSLKLERATQRAKRRNEESQIEGSVESDPEDD